MVNTEIKLIIFFAAKMQKLYTVSKNKTWSWLWLRSWAPYTKFRLKLKKVGKTTRLFRYDQNQIPYDYIVEVIYRFKGLDLVDRAHEELWLEINNIVQEEWSKPSQRKRNARRQNCSLMKPYKYLRKEEKWKAKEKGKDISNWMQCSRKEQGEIRKPS